MAWTIPDPPDDSCFILDKDDQGNPRLSWNLPDEPRRDAGKAFVSFFLAAWILVGLVVAVCLVVEVIALIGGRGRPATIIGGGLWLVMWSAAAYCLARILQKYLIDPDPENLTLTDSVLKYDPGFSNYYRVLVQRAVFTAKKTEIPRRRIWEISSEYWSRHFGILRIRFGYDELEIGPSLKRSELEWLAEVLKDWVGRDKLPSIKSANPTNLSQPAPLR